MNNRFFSIAGAVCLGLCLLFLVLSSPTRAATVGVSTAVSLPPSPSPSVRAILYLREQLDLNQFSAIPDETVRHIALVEQLQAVANQTQNSLREKLTGLQASGQIESFRPLWIVNAIAVTGPEEVVYKLADQPEVAHIAPDEARPLVQPPQIREGVEMEWLTAVLPATRHSQSLPWGIERVKAPYVWHGLGVSGQGVTVAIMDSGVDWLHPDLNPNYRGNLPGGGVSHFGHWYNAADPTVAEPFDGLGHGTHVAGTAVGQNGIGVAPGANWIAVNIATPDGLIFNSDAHAGFQWLLAPGGDPTLAPDVVNGSWGGPGWLTTFAADLQALHLAGILTVFAAGNSGPESGSIFSPASLPGVFAVGASDPRDSVAWFSSRGPSPLTGEVKPAIVAPGTMILSALPGGQYGYYNGTSMAAPHTAGAAALLLSANPALSRPEVMAGLTETAVPLAAPIPNLTSGWGRLDVYAAASAQTQLNVGILEGVVRQNGIPLPGVVVTATTSGGVELAFVSDENGRYRARLKPGLYQIHTAPFGFAPIGASNLAVQAGQTTQRDLTLDRLPSGTLNLLVYDSVAQRPITATLTILQTPISQNVGDDGWTSFILPAGHYQLRINRAGYRLAKPTIAISENGTHSLFAHLTPIERVALVDSGAWYYQSYADYYREALVGLNVSFDELPIHNPFPNEQPSAADLSRYDVVIWSAPFDSPGYIGANETISEYLEAGGKLLISGQNLGYFDGVSFFLEPWWHTLLGAQYLGKTAVTHTISGAPESPFAGLSFDLNGPNSAQNQTAVDQSRPRPSALTDESFYYEDGRAAGLYASQCRPYHLAYLGFGLEGVSRAADRQAILSRTLAQFNAPPVAHGGRWLPETIDDFATPGAAMTYTLRLQNLSETLTDTFRLSLSGDPWGDEITPTRQTLGPCQTAVVTLTVRPPAEVVRDTVFTWRVTAVSQNNPTTQVQLPIRHKTPGHILLVDDDRWYDQETIYQEALEQAGFRYDYWDIGWDNNARGSPPGDLLNAYDFVIWFTGYDWFRPVSPAENMTLRAYLAQGGRLFLSSQDFLYYHRHTPLARHYLGVLSYLESITPTQVYAAHPTLPPETTGPLPLDYPPFRNNSDGLIAAPGVEPFLWHDQGMLAGLAADGAKTRPVGMQRPFRAIFWAVPFEKTPVALHPALMGGILGWLSDLGDSTFTVDRPVGVAGETRQYTITLRNGPTAPNQTSLTNNLPAELEFVAFTEAGGAVYEPAGRQVRWSGLLAEGGEQVISYLAAPSAALPPGAQINNDLEIVYDRHAMRLTRTAVLALDAPDLHASRLSAAVLADQPTQFVTYTLTLVNEGVAATGEITAVLRLPDPLHPLTSTLWSSAGEAVLSEQRVTWQTALQPGQRISLTLALTRPVSASGPDWLSAAAYIETGNGPPLIRGHVAHAPPYRFYLPIIARP